MPLIDLLTPFADNAMPRPVVAAKAENGKSAAGLYASYLIIEVCLVVSKNGGLRGP